MNLVNPAPELKYCGPGLLKAPSLLLTGGDDPNLISTLYKGLGMARTIAGPPPQDPPQTMCNDFIE